MDYLDVKKEFRQHILLLVGYVLVAVAIVIATLVLVYQAYGFNIGKNGTVIQNGLVFFSSQPNPANIYLNGHISSQKTNTRLILPSGIYGLKLTRNGYRDWTRTITVNGGAVAHFDYPFLIPKSLQTQKIQSYQSAPALMTQSLDKRWILVQKPGSSTDFDLYDLKTPSKPVITSLSIPSSILGKATTSESLNLVSWADDNQHVLLKHNFDSQSEFILVDIVDPTQSLNLNSTLQISPSVLTLNNEKYDSYYAYNATTQELDSASLGGTAVTPVLQHVLAYKSYSNNTILYATDSNAPTGKVMVRLKEGSQTYDIRALPLSSHYLLDLTTYNSSLYVAVGSNADNRVYIYQDPVSQLTNYPGQGLAPSWVLHVPSPSYLSFSANAQFIVAENGSNYASYDVQNNLGYLYSNANSPVDSPQLHASWMDGDRLTYVSNGKLVIQDYDNNNRQVLVSALPSYIPAFSSDYKYLYSLSPVANSSQVELDMTPLMIPSDL